MAVAIGGKEMKYSEMNTRQKIATKLALESCGWVVGGYENTMADNEPDSEEYIEAKESLADHDGLADEIYDHLISWTDRGYMKHLRFVGKAFIMERINNRLAKWGY